MKATAILLVLIATGTILLGPASAGAGGSDESAMKIDLRPAQGPMLYLACDRGVDLASVNCGVISLWQESNHWGLGTTLQKSKVGGVYDPDALLLP